MISIGREYEFAAAHLLPNHQGKCKSLHGHNYKVEVVVARHSGSVIQDAAASDRGMVMDFGDLDSYVDQVLDPFDHTLLNDHVPFNLIPPTAEHLAEKIAYGLMRQLQNTGVYVARVRIWETSRSYAEWTRDGID